MPNRGQQVSTKKRRAAFVERLRALGPGSECVTWPWTTNAKTYALISVDGRNTTVHRWVYEQINGPLGSLEACHSCDNPACVRPSHIWPGTHAENMRDSFRKGRHPIRRGGQPPGEAHHNARLSAVEVYAIRRLASQGVSHGTIAASFGMARPTVTRIVNRTLWKHLPDEPTTQSPAVQA